MAGLPKLPGLSFMDPTVTSFHLCHSFDYINGYKRAKSIVPGKGGRETDANSVAYVGNYDPVRFDPSLIYGRTRSKQQEQFLPHYALYDQKCLTFKAFFKQSVFESPDEFYRVRNVNIIYFLEDDTITIMEPRINNSGLNQGRLVRRGKIPKTQMGTYWHWKDLGVGKDIAINGIVYHTVSCDKFTREYMQSQGLDMGPPEEMPMDPYTQTRAMQTAISTTKTPPADDKFRRFLEYDGKVLKFSALWDDRDSEYGEMRPCQILYFLSDDTISVKEIHELNSGRDPFPQLLRKTKLPKIYTDRPVTYPSIYLELSDAEVTEYYQPKDLIVGDTIFVLGRKMFLYDCDEFTRNYFRKVLCIEQEPRIKVEEDKRSQPPRPMPPHDGFGTLEDSLQNTFTVMPRPPRKDVLKQLLNANKYLRYEMKFDVVHPEDSVRKFILLYSLADGTAKIHEPPIRNSGITGGRYLRSTMLVKPGSNPLNPDFYTPADFYVGAVVKVFEQRFIITDLDLYVYRYMQANPDKFPCEVIENVRNHLFNLGLLKGDLDDQVDENKELEKKHQRDALVKELSYPLDNLQQCMKDLRVGAGESPEQEARKRAQIVQEYEDGLKHKFMVPPHGILPVNKECAYPIVIGDVQSTECEGVGPKAEIPPPKANVVCFERRPVICNEMHIDENVGKIVDLQPKDEHKPIMVHAPELPPRACAVKQVRFALTDPCERDRLDLCNFKHKDIPCECTHYEKR